MRNQKTTFPPFKFSLLPVLLRKFYWKIAMPIHLLMVWGCFCTTTELSSGDRDCMTQKNKKVYYLYK